MESPKNIFLTDLGSYSSWSENRISDGDIEYVKVNTDIIEINCLADIQITRHTISNHLSFLFPNELSIMFRHLKNYKIEIHIKSLFNRISRDSIFNEMKVEKRIALDNGISMLRVMLLFNIEFYLINSGSMEEEMEKLKSISLPIHEKCIKRIINK